MYIVLSSATSIPLFGIASFTLGHSYFADLTHVMTSNARKEK